MEYYRGIMFLTTNQPLQLDWAIMSRVSYIVRYPDLEPHQKTIIREEALERITKTGIYDIHPGALKAWEEMDESKFISNGRQIINGKYHLSEISMPRLTGML